MTYSLISGFSRLDVQEGRLGTGRLPSRDLLLTFAPPAPPKARFYVLLNIEFVAAKPLLVTGYLLGASKEMLTKHSRYIRIAPIKIIREGAQPKAVKV
jgi:hypothetical protein